MWYNTSVLPSNAGPFHLLPTQYYQYYSILVLQEILHKKFFSPNNCQECFGTSKELQFPITAIKGAKSVAPWQCSCSQHVLHEDIVCQELQVDQVLISNPPSTFGKNWNAKCTPGLLDISAWSYQIPCSSKRKNPHNTLKSSEKPHEESGGYKTKKWGPNIFKTYGSVTVTCQCALHGQVSPYFCAYRIQYCPFFCHGRKTSLYIFVYS